MIGLEDPFRKEYRELSDDEKAHMARIKERASDLFQELRCPQNDLSTCDQRYMAIARTTLEEAVMWGVKGVTA